MHRNASTFRQAVCACVRIGGEHFNWTHLKLVMKNIDTPTVCR